MKQESRTEYRASTNRTTRTVTIREYWNKKFIAKFRTATLSLAELEEFECMTSNDIKNWMKENQSYYVVK